MKTPNPIVRSLRSACCIAIAALSFASTCRMEAGEQVPFMAVFETEAVSTVNFPFASVKVVGEGQATHLGRTLTATTNQLVNLITGAGTATYQFVAANNDVLNVSFAFTALPLPGGPGLSLNGTWTVISGTGRFAGATGSGSTTGSVRFTSETTGIGQFSMIGTISSPGGAP